MSSILDPRGIRNNNPGNILLSKTAWLGQRPPPQADPDFVEFTAPIYGLRALMKTLLTYYLKHKLDTVGSMINRYAPPHENATDSYTRGVAKALNVNRGDKIDLRSKRTLIALAQAIVRQENGRPPLGRPASWYDAALYERAASCVLPERD